MAPELAGKRLELLREVVPGIRRMAILWNPAGPGMRIQIQEIQAAAARGGIHLDVAGGAQPAGVRPRLSDHGRQGVGAAIILDDALFYNERTRIVDAGGAEPDPSDVRSPGVCGSRRPPVLWPELHELFRRAATFVDKILKGAKPGDLPVEQPTKFDAGHQPQDRPGARPHDSADAPLPGGRGDPLGGRRERRRRKKPRWNNTLSTTYLLTETAPNIALQPTQVASAPASLPLSGAAERQRSAARLRERGTEHDLGSQSSCPHTGWTPVVTE